MTNKDEMLIMTRKLKDGSFVERSSGKNRATKKVRSITFENDNGIRADLNKAADKIYLSRKKEKEAKKDISGSRTTILALMRLLKRKEKIRFEGKKYVIELNETIRTHVDAARMVNFFNHKGDVGKKHLKKLIRMGVVKFDKGMLESYCEMNRITLPANYIVDDPVIINVDVEPRLL